MGLTFPDRKKVGGKVRFFFFIYIQLVKRGGNLNIVAWDGFIFI